MKMKEWRDTAVKLRDELAEHGPSEKWAMQRRMLATVLTLHRFQLEYEKLKSRRDVHIPLFETDLPLSIDDRKNFVEASTVNRQIDKQLSDL